MGLLFLMLCLVRMFFPVSRYEAGCGASLCCPVQISNLTIHAHKITALRVPAETVRIDLALTHGSGVMNTLVIGKLDNRVPSVFATERLSITRWVLRSEAKAIRKS